MIASERLHVPAPALGPTDERPIKPLTERDFRRYQRILEDGVGIYLSDVKKPLLVARLLRRLRELGLDSFGDYLDRAEDDDAERQRMVDALCTNETHFFREPRHFDFLAGDLLPRWQAAAEEGARPRRLRVLSAGCSTGQECYSLAMLMLDACAGWDVDILGIDVSTKALAVARAAVWPVDRLRELPEQHRKRYMLRGTGDNEGRVKVAPEVRALVRFSHGNLTDSSNLGGPFDLIFCRNVLIYFRPHAKAQVIARLIDQLGPDGHLFLGHAESLLGTRGIDTVVPNVYARSVRARER